MILVDTNVVVDVLDDDSIWYAWSAEQIRNQTKVHELVINPIVYAEISPMFESVADQDARMEDLDFKFREIPRSALFIAGLAHRHYRQDGGPRNSILADFLIGAHAAVLGCSILTRDAKRYRQNFPRVPLVTP